MQATLTPNAETCIFSIKTKYSHFSLRGELSEVRNDSPIGKGYDVLYKAGVSNGR
jgi:hypothetical protein